MPRGLHEGDHHLLGDIVDKDILEVGCGSAPCARWLAGHGARAVGLDISMGMLSRGVDAMTAGGPHVPLIQASAELLPFADESFDIVCSAFGAVPFVADSQQVMNEVARVLRPGGKWVFAVNHPIRWIFPDDPGPKGLTATLPYFDRTPYVEVDENGVPTYVEHHRTIGDRVRELVAAGLQVHDIIEPEWPEWLTVSGDSGVPYAASSFRAPRYSAPSNPERYSRFDRNALVRSCCGLASSCRGSPDSTTTPPSMNTS